MPIKIYGSSIGWAPSQNKKIKSPAKIQNIIFPNIEFCLSIPEKNQRINGKVKHTSKEPPITTTPKVFEGIARSIA